MWFLATVVCRAYDCVVFGGVAVDLSRRVLEDNRTEPESDMNQRNQFIIQSSVLNVTARVVFC